ncbi:hypothetical protein LFM09_14780 [Lentzea alba]|uniref:hypothetical protein n=1 Tax=Lentzea alba TaxID=2714351 RepID=UPI0039BF3930
MSAEQFHWLPRFKKRHQENRLEEAAPQAPPDPDWSEGRAVFRMPETTDEDLDLMRAIHSEDERKMFNVALTEVLEELGDPGMRQERLQRARQFDQKNARRILARAANAYRSKKLTQQQFKDEYLRKFILFAPGSQLPIVVEEEAGYPVAPVFSSLQALQEEFGPDQEYIEGTGQAYLEFQIRRRCNLLLDRGKPHAITLPPTSQAESEVSINA